MSPLAGKAAASTKSLGSSKVPFVEQAEGEICKTSSEDEPVGTIDFHALRKAFSRGNNTLDALGSNLDSKKPPAGRRHSALGPSTSYQNLSSSSNSATSAPPTFSREPSSRSMGTTPPPDKIISRRHSEVAISTLSLLENKAAASATAATPGNDIASKCAAALKMDRSAFLELEAEEGCESNTLDGAVAIFYSYRELVRRNFSKEYLDLTQSELEKYLSDGEFASVFSKSKVPPPHLRCVGYVHITR